ncbi:hypothetical protein SAMN05661012_05084 [Chitinophaga sancti]|uniref:Uncharacterized protein n=2 Tax=Chitinophaga sancti TaxID=1004 RepID=A0A1K1SAW0_9BACT|nr:hypothetical protein SAMN05661012_05084 [Chitinophaga sancti]
MLSNKWGVYKYVHTDPPQAPPFNKISYNAMRFTDSSFVYYSMRIYDSISNNIVSHNVGSADRFTVEKGEIKHEYLLGRDFEIYNIFMYATISEDGDTIRFYASETYQMSNGRKEKKTVEEFIYNPTLTFIPGKGK